MAKGLGGIMKQMQKVQRRMLQVQEELAQKRVEGTAGGGMVRVIATGQQEILEIKIDPQVVDPEGVDILEDLVLAAVRQAREKAQAMMEEEMGQITGGLSIPGLNF